MQIKKSAILFLLFFCKATFAQVPFDYLDDNNGISKPYNYFQKVLTNEAGDKWIIIYNEYTNETVGYTTPNALLFNLTKVDSAYRKRLQLQKKSKKELTSEEEEQLSDIGALIIPYQYFGRQNQIDSVIAAFKLTVTPVAENMHTYFSYKIHLKSISIVRCGNATDCFGGKYSDYDLRLYDKKGKLFKINLACQYMSKKELRTCFERALCWQQNNRHFGIILYSYVDARGMDNFEHLILYNRL